MERDPTGSASGRSKLRFDANLQWLFTELPFEERFAAAATYGFRAVEVPVPYSYRTPTLGHLLADAGLHLVLINSPGGEAGLPTEYGTACNPEQVAEFRAGIPRALEYATALSVPYIHLMAGIVPDSVPYNVAYATYVENLAWAADEAAQTDVTLLVEVLNQHDVPGFVLRSQQQAVDAIERVGNSRVRLMFDIYHCQRNEGSVMTRWRELLPMIGHIQVADAPDRHEPGTGELPWERLFGEIAARGYDGWIGCEYRPSVDTASSLRWRDRLAFVSEDTNQPTE